MENNEEKWVGFCPLINAECKRNDCRLWNPESNDFDGECSIFAFLESVERNLEYIMDVSNNFKTFTER